MRRNLRNLPAIRALASSPLIAVVLACSQTASAPEPRAEGSSPASLPPLHRAPLLASTAPAAKAKPMLQPCPAHVPEALNPPADVTLQLALPASGVQIYVCNTGKPGDAPTWNLEAPHATLGTSTSPQVIHFAGPIWQALDGSQIKGAKLAAADAPDAKAIAWLLLSATPSGAGTLEHVSHVQRLDTIGGKAPASGCDPSHIGAKVLVPYRANYYFYGPAAAGEPIHQCRSAAPKKPAAS
jgi:hypothetical protein